MSFIDLFRHPEGLVDLSPLSVKEMMDSNDDLKVIDVRTSSEFSRFHLDGAMHIPLGRIVKQSEDLNKGTGYILICKTGHRSQAAAAELFRKGFTNLYHLKGGMNAWNREFKK